MNSLPIMKFKENAAVMANGISALEFDGFDRLFGFSQSKGKVLRRSCGKHLSFIKGGNLRELREGPA